MRAVEKDDFDQAIIIKEQIKNLKKNAPFSDYQQEDHSETPLQFQTPAKAKLNSEYKQKDIENPDERPIPTLNQDIKN